VDELARDKEMGAEQKRKREELDDEQRVLRSVKEYQVHIYIDIKIDR